MKIRASKSYGCLPVSLLPAVTFHLSNQQPEMWSGRSAGVAASQTDYQAGHISYTLTQHIKPEFFTKLEMNKTVGNANHWYEIWRNNGFKVHHYFSSFPSNMYQENIQERCLKCQNTLGDLEMSIWHQIINTLELSAPWNRGKPPQKKKGRTVKQPHCETV